MRRKRILSVILTLAISASLLTTGLVPGGAAAAAPAPANTPFDPDGPAGGYMNLAYIYNQSEANLRAIDLTPLTHINYAFGLMHNDEFLDPDAPGFGSRESWNLWNSNPALRDTVYLSANDRSRLAVLIEERDAEAPWVKIALSVGGGGMKGFSNMSQDPARRAVFIQSCVDTVDEFGLDGIDLDWEFPSMDGWEGIKGNVNDRNTFTILLKELREALDAYKPGLQLTIASSGNTLFPEHWTNFKEAIEYLDYCLIMTYDFRYDNQYYDWPLGSSRDWPTLDTESGWNALMAVEHYVGAGIPREKLAIGHKPGSQTFPYSSGIGPNMADVITKYTGVTPTSNRWPGVTIQDIEQLIDEGKITGPYVTAAPTVLWWQWLNNAISASNWSAAANGDNIPARVLNGLDGKTFTGTVSGDSKQFEFHRGYDRLGGLAYAYAYNLTDDPGKKYKLFAFSYDDEESMAARAEYIKGAGLLGVFFWSYGNNSATIWNTQQWSVALKNTESPPAPDPSEYINLGYIYSSSLSTIDNLDLSAVTHVNYAFGLIYNEEYKDPAAPRYGSPEGWGNAVELEANPALLHTVRVGEWNSRNSSNVTDPTVRPRPGELALHRIVEQRDKYAPDTKVLLSIGGDGCRGFSDAAANSANRAIFIDSCLEIVEEYGLDGIDLDWEFPSMDGWGGIKCTVNDRDNFTLLLKELREALDLYEPGLLLTIAGSGNTLFPQDWTNLAEASEYLDYINIMTYDFRYGSSYFDWALGSSRNWATLQNTDDWTADYAVFNYVSAGVPRNKLTIGYKPGNTTMPGDIRTLVNGALGPNGHDGDNLASSWNQMIYSGTTIAPLTTMQKGTALASTQNWNWVNSALTASGWNSGANASRPMYVNVMENLDGKTFTGTSGGVSKSIEFWYDYDRIAGLGTVIAYNLTDDPLKENGALFVMSFNDPRSIARRASYAKENGLLGTFFWSYGDSANTRYVTKAYSAELGKYNYVDGLEIDNDEVTILTRGQETLNPIFSPADATNKRVRWSSSDTSIATVSEDGVVTGVAAGTCVITGVADDGEGQFTATSDITVLPAAYISITGPATVVSGAGATVSYTISGDNIPPISGMEFEFEVDGDFLSSKSFEALNGFSILSSGNYGTPVWWKNAGNTWTGKALLFNPDGAGGDIDLFTMEFYATEGKLGVTDVKLNSVTLSFIGGNVISVLVDSVASTEFTQYYSPYDLNKDGVIDLNDLTYALQFLNVTSSDPEWDDAQFCDFKPDGTIDISDLILILANYTVPYYS